MRRGLALVVMALISVGACTDKKDSTSTPSSAKAGDEIASAACPADELIRCAKDSTLGDAVPDQPTQASGEPIVIGMINQDAGPSASPELTQSVSAAIDFINEELGGVDGRPLKLIPCNTQYSPAGSEECGRSLVDAGAVAVVGGIDVFGDGIRVLANDGIPYVGGIPASMLSATSPNSFQFSGGAWGAFVAFADYASKELDAVRAATVYNDLESMTDAASYAQRVFELNGVEDTSISYPITEFDVAQPLARATASAPDAVIVGTTPASCDSAYRASAQLGRETTNLMFGPCARPELIEAAGERALDSTIFNVEGPLDEDGPNTDTRLYAGVIKKYGEDVEPTSSTTPTFRSIMNLWAQLVDIGAAKVTPAAITEAFATAKKVPGFMGHDYTCDPAPIAALPALCAPQQVLVQFEGGALKRLTDWIDVAKIVTDVEDAKSSVSQG
jgi:branched-chain amino acid transport system substrate-binding protein